MDYEALMRRKLLDQMYEKMSDEQKRLFVYMSMEGRNHEEIMQALQKQQQQLADIRKGQNWAVDLGSDIAANFLTDGLIWLGSKLLKKF